MCNIQSQEAIKIDVEITDILTIRTCAVLINEIIKCLVHQKNQIPYPYVWLKSVVSRKRKCIDSANNKINNLSLERHYKIVCSAYDTLEEIMKNVQSEFEKQSNTIKEILIVFGTTAQSPKEVFTIKMPKEITRLCEASDVLHKHRHKILRKLFLSQDWLKAIDSTLSATNMYVILKKQNNETSRNHFFAPIEHYILPSKVKNVIINFYYGAKPLHTYCDDMFIFQDVVKEDKKDNSSVDCKINSDEFDDQSYSFFQASTLLKGYKDYFVNKTSATELF